MDPRTFPTKGNLMLAKNSLALAKQGYDLMDKKRNILIRELMDLIDEARTIQEEIDTTFTYAYECLQRANIENGISNVEMLAYTVPIENSITIQTRSIMGTEIPHVKYMPDAGKPTYSFSTTRESIDKAREAFRKVKDLTVKLSMVENAAYRLAGNIKKTQKRANALQNITIPMYTSLVYTITNALEEKEREEFTRLKVIKACRNERCRKEEGITMSNEEQKSITPGIYLWLIAVNIYISMFAFGGGYVVVPLVRRSFVEKKKIFTEDELMEMSAVAQSSPGAIAVNLAALSGYKAAGTAGAVISCAASVIPPLVILGIISGFYDLFIANKIVAAVLKGMQSGVAALIVSVVADMCTVILKEKSFFLFSLIPIAFIANFIFDVNVALILAVCCGLCILRVYVRSGGHKWKFF